MSVLQQSGEEAAQFQASAVLLGGGSSCTARSLSRCQGNQRIRRSQAMARVGQCGRECRESQRRSAPGFLVQAVLALREAVLGRWALLGRPAQQATLHFLLHLALGAARQPGPLLRAQVNGAAAAIIKRGWLEAAGEEQAAPLLAIHSLSTQAGTAEARRAGLELLTAVVEEFSPATASTMGLSWWVVGGGWWVGG